MSSLSTLPKGDSAWLLRKSIQRVMQQVSVLETNIGSSTTGNSANTQIIFNDAGTLRGDAQFTWNKTLNRLTVDGDETISGDLTVASSILKVDSTNERVGIGTATPAVRLNVADADNPANGTIRLGVGAIYSQIKMSASSTGRTDFTNVGNGVNGAYNFSIEGQDQYRIAASGVFTWYDGAGGTRMTLNSTGLGVGVPSPAFKLDVSGSAGSGIRFTGNSVSTVMGETGGFGLLGTTTNHNLGLYTNGSVKATIDTSGNVGVGVTPSAWASGAKAFQISSFFAAWQGSNGSSNLGFAVYEGGANTYNYRTTGDSPTFYSQLTGAHRWYTATSGTAGDPITGFATARMTLDANGNLLVGTTSAGGNRLNVQTASGDCTTLIKSQAANVNSAIDYVSNYANHTIRKSGTAVWDFGVINDASATPAFKISNASAVGVQLVSGATAWTTLSDETVKDIIEPIGNAVAKVGSLRSVIGKFKTDSEGTRRSFLIAQDVKSVLPEAVDVVGENNELGLRYTEVIPLLVAAIKELTAEVNALKNA